MPLSRASYSSRSISQIAKNKAKELDKSIKDKSNQLLMGTRDSTGILTFNFRKSSTFEKNQLEDARSSLIFNKKHTSAKNIKTAVPKNTHNLKPQLNS
jgi:hypothetical protein